MKGGKNMTNNKLCNIFCGVGCGISFWCMGMMFFGATSAIWGALVGMILILIGYFNYE